MAALIFAILFSTALFVLFRLFGRYRLSLLQVVAVNYVVCTLCAILHHPTYFSGLQQAPVAWLPLAVLTGAFFIVVFNLVGFASQSIGVAYTALLTKLSVVVPTLVSFAVFAEDMGPLRWLGIVLALLAVVLLYWKQLTASRRPQPEAAVAPRAGGWLVAAALFVGAGIVDTLLKLFDGWFAGQVPAHLNVTTLFGVAAVLGMASVAAKLGRGGARLHWHNALAGLVLGVPNYFSVVFVSQGLAELEGTVFFPLNNIGQLVLATLAAAILFREKLNAHAVAGIALAVLAVLLIAFRHLAAFFRF